MWSADSVYLGRKWFANGVGLLGWSFDVCNETYDMELLDYDIVGGSGYWPMAIGNSWVFYSEWDFSTTEAPIASITVDGDGSDWAALSPVIRDQQGDDTTGADGVDIRDLYAATDGTNLYLMVNFWDGPPDSGWAMGDYWAYTFVIDEDEGWYYAFSLGYFPDPVQWLLSSPIVDLTGAVWSCSDVIEISIPLANLGPFASELPGLYLQIGLAGEYDYSCFNTVSIPVVACPIVTPGDLNGSADVTGSDVISLVNYVYKAGPDPQPCPAAADMNCSGDVTGSDVISLVNYVYKGGPMPCDVCPMIPGTWTCP
jgi:hypothetical protein